MFTNVGWPLRPGFSLLHAVHLKKNTVDSPRRPPPHLDHQTFSGSFSGPLCLRGATRPFEKVTLFKFPLKIGTCGL